MERKEIKKRLIDAYNSNQADIRINSAPVLNDLRDEAFSYFEQNGFLDSEKGKGSASRIDEVFDRSYKLFFSPESITVDVNEVFHCDVPELKTSPVLIVDGWYYNNESLLQEFPDGVIIGSLAEASRKFPDLVSAHYSKYAGPASSEVISLNTMFAQDGFFIWIPDGVVLEQPIQIINLAIANEEKLFHPRNLIVAGKNSEAKIIVCDHSLYPFPFLMNSVTEIAAAKDARVDYYKVQNAHIHSSQFSSTGIYQEKNSHVMMSTITLHGGYIRNNVSVLLNGEGSESQINGLFLVDRHQYVDNRTFIDHAKPGCQSRQLFKGVLDDQAYGSFNGKIKVRQNAQHTLAYQSNNNILLSSEAKMKTKPLLEIYADDVKCTHGATVGQLDGNALFYLRSRGIDEKEARFLMMYAFAHEIIGKISVEPLKDRIDGLVDKRLRGELSRCNSCQMKCG